ncbi:MAG: hydantoinase/oxoprolinase family protein [Gemmatimonadetes bacterium]|nr:hydantoinase/oxoprolinase family protein [Gemmatimonadota bacterium]
MIIGADTGGTFTDFVAVHESGVWTWKVPSTPDDFARGVLDGLAKLLESGTERSDPAETTLVHASTVATNALLERKGARSALVTTRGFGDVLAIGRQTRPHLYDLSARPEPPLVPATMRFEVDERVTADGEVLEALTPAEIERVLDRLAADTESLAVCLLFSFLAPKHERAIGEAARARGLDVSLSCEVAPEFREYERTSTTVVNAYVAPVVRSYVERLAEGAASAGIGRLQVVHSGGGSSSPQAAAERAVATVLSGPAAGAMGALEVARQTVGPDPKVISLDMGGTSADISLIDGQLGKTTHTVIGGLPIQASMVDIHTVGAGGGSIARLDAGGALLVGPESAGADPGPACYGRGGAPTVTDANLLLRRIDPSYFLGGRMALDIERAETAIEQLAEPMGVDRESAARSIVAVVNANMERAVRVISVQRGYDPRDFAMIAFGGAAGLHACALAESLGMTSVIVPRDPGVLSARGAAESDVVKEYSRTVMRPLKQDVDLADVFASLEVEAHAAFDRERVGWESVAMTRAADARYRGQSHELTVGWHDAPAAVATAFHAAHQRYHGYSAEEEPIEIVTVRLRVVAAVERPPPTELTAGATVKEATLDVRDDVTVIDRTALAARAQVVGPALLVEPYATTYLPTGWSARVDAYGHLLLVSGAA